MERGEKRAAENEFLAYDLEEDSSCCRLFLDLCFPARSSHAQPAEKDQRKIHFARVEYRPLIDWNILTGNTLLQTAGGAYYFPQTHQTLWPEHGAHYRPIKASPVVSEQPFGSERIRRSARLFSVLTGRKRAQTSPTMSKEHDTHRYLSPSLAQSCIDDPNQPTLTLSVIHDIQTSTLTIFLKFASNLNYLMENPHKQLVHTSVNLYMFPSKNEIFQTRTDPSHESNNPILHQDFVFSGVPVSDLVEQILVFRVYHGRTLIGVLKIPLNSIDLLGFTICKPIEKITDLTEQDRNSAGDIQIGLTYHPDTEVVEGAILRVTNLRQQLISMHPPRPYINIYLTHDGKRYAKWKSSVHYDTAVQVFNEAFQFNVSKMDTSLIKLCIHVKEYHRTHFNNLLGVVEIGSTAKGAGSLHWQEVVTSPRQKISHWHSVIPLEGTHIHPAATSSEMATVGATNT